MTHNDEPLACLDDYYGDCEGGVELRYPMSPTGKWFPRCEKHFAERLRRQDEINRRYPATAPSDWSHYDAGEYWDEY